MAVERRILGRLGKLIEIEHVLLEPLAVGFARRDRFLVDGLTLNRPVTIRPDARELHILVRDVASGATGSLVIPLK